MPELSRFYGMVIYMNYKPREHEPPHFHVRYQGVDYVFSIETGQALNGTVKPYPRMASMIKDWWQINKMALALAWKSQRFPKLKPLK